MWKRTESLWTMEVDRYSEFIKDNTIKRPDFQRLLDQNRVEKMLKIFLENLREYQHLHTVEEITIAKSSSTTWVIDGQHRLECFRQLYENYYIDVSMVVRCMKVEDIEGAEYWFSIVNKAHPMPHLPKGMMSYADTNKLYEAFCKAFPCKGIFNNNPRAHIPKMYKNHFITKISYYIKTHPTTAEEFIEKVRAFNDEVSKKVKVGNINYFQKYNIGTEWKESTFRARFNACIDVCGGFCLGLFNKHDWVEILDKYDGGTICHKPKKTAIPQALKKQLWIRIFGKEFIGKCTVCECVLDTWSFEAGHITAESNGGETCIDNLMPICPSCNKSQGTKDMFEFKKMFLSKE